MNRRDFLKKAGSFSLATGLNASVFSSMYLFVDQVYLQDSEKIEIKKQFKDEIGNTVKKELQEERKSIYVDERHDTQEGFFHNYGVTHTAEFFKIQRNRILELIKESDIVALERSDNYFLALARYATQEGKKVYCIDSKNRETEDVGVMNTVFSSALALANIITHKEILEGKKVRWILKTLFAHLLSATASYPESFLTLSSEKNKYPAQNDYSYIIDGRTVFMADNSQELIKKYPNKKILAITGNIHAQGIEHYFENQDILERRLKLYDVIYGPLSSNLERY